MGREETMNQRVQIEEIRRDCDPEKDGRRIVVEDTQRGKDRWEAA